MSFSILFARAHCQYRSAAERYWLAADRDQINTIVAMLIIMATVFSLSRHRPYRFGIVQPLSVHLASSTG